VPVPVAPDRPPDLVVGTAVDPFDDPHAAPSAMTEIVTEMAIVATLARAGRGTCQP
jgi:hypothetical protein